MAPFKDFFWRLKSPLRQICYIGLHNKTRSKKMYDELSLLKVICKHYAIIQVLLNSVCCVRFLPQPKTSIILDLSSAHAERPQVSVAFEFYRSLSMWNRRKGLNKLWDLRRLLWHSRELLHPEVVACLWRHAVSRRQASRARAQRNARARRCVSTITQNLIYTVKRSFQPFYFHPTAHRQWAGHESTPTTEKRGERNTVNGVRTSAPMTSCIHAQLQTTRLSLLQPDIKGEEVWSQSQEFFHFNLGKKPNSFPT